MLGTFLFSVLILFVEKQHTCYNHFNRLIFSSSVVADKLLQFTFLLPELLFNTCISSITILFPPCASIPGLMFLQVVHTKCVYLHITVYINVLHVFTYLGGSGFH